MCKGVGQLLAEVSSFTIFLLICRSKTFIQNVIHHLTKCNLFIAKFRVCWAVDNSINTILHMGLKLSKSSELITLNMFTPMFNFLNHCNCKKRLISEHSASTSGTRVLSTLRADEMAIGPANGTSRQTGHSTWF